MTKTQKSYLDQTGVEVLWNAVKGQVATKGSSITYDEAQKMIYLKDANGKILGNGISAAPFIKDGMLTDVSIISSSAENPITYEDVVYNDGTKFIAFTWNTDAGISTDYLKVDEIGKIYSGAEGEIAISSENVISVENIDATKTTLGSDIQIAGGPLANDIAESGEVWPDDWKDASGNKIIPSGKSMEEILTALFLKVVNGTVAWQTVSWNPTLAEPTAKLSGDSTVEVGTTLTATTATNSTVSGNTRSAVCKTTQGYFDTVDGSWNSGNKSISEKGTTSGTASITWTWNGTTTTDTSLVVTIDGTNTLTVSQSGVTASVDALPETTVYASTNTKAVLSSVSATLSDTKPADKTLTSSKSDTVTGAYKAFIGYVDAVPTDSVGVRALNNGTKLGKGAVGTANAVYTIDKNYMVVALPSGWDFTIQNSLGQDAQRDSFDLSGTVNVVLPDNTTKVYNVYYIGWKDGQYKNLIIK